MKSNSLSLNKDSMRKLIETEINPHVAEWEEIKQFPVHEVMKKFGEGGFLGASFPEEDGGMGLDYSYTVAIAETMGEIRCGAIPMAIGVQVTLLLGISYEFSFDLQILVSSESFIPRNFTMIKDKDGLTVRV